MHTKKSWSKLQQPGLPTHRPPHTTCRSRLRRRSLGLALLGHRAYSRCFHVRMWRLRLGLLEVARRGRGTAHQLEIPVGHFISRALLRRELLAVCGTVYKLIAVHRADINRSIHLWESVRRELTWVDHRIHLAQRSLTAFWAPVVYCFDGSWWGVGIVKKRAPIQLIRDVARRNERWRFSKEEEAD